MFARNVLAKRLSSAVTHHHPPVKTSIFKNPDFSGNNWVDKGTLPFQTKKRLQFNIFFYGTIILAFGFPVAVIENQIKHLRKAARAKKAAKKAADKLALLSE
jgi:hypothetical protein